MNQELAGIHLVIDGEVDTDPEEVSRLTAQLRRRLLELDVTNVEFVRSGEVPEGAKPVDAVAIGALVISAAPAVLQAVVGLVKSWLEAKPVRNAKVTIGGDSIELIGASEVEQERLVRAFIERHSTGPAKSG